MIFPKAVFDHISQGDLDRLNLGPHYVALAVLELSLCRPGWNSQRSTCLFLGLKACTNMPDFRTSS